VDDRWPSELPAPLPRLSLSPPRVGLRRGPTLLRSLADPILHLGGSAGQVGDRARHCLRGVVLAVDNRLGDPSGATLAHTQVADWRSNFSSSFLARRYGARPGISIAESRTGRGKLDAIRGKKLDRITRRLAMVRLMEAGRGTGASRRPMLSREFLDGHRRTRHFDACAELLHEFGRDGLTAATIVRVAGTSRSTFYELFNSVEDCLSQAIVAADAEIFANLDPAAGPWVAEVERAIRSFLAAVAARPLVAEILLIHSRTARSDSGLELGWATGERFVPLLRRGRAEAEVLGRPVPGEMTEEMLSRGIVELAAFRVRGDEVAGLPTETGFLARLTTSFYLGAEIAEERVAAVSSGSPALAP
jgi:AcrR family transcriptional regulator